MKVLSRWKLIFDPSGTPKTLIDLGDLIEEELAWKLARNVEVVPLAASAAPFIRPANNNSYSLDFTVYKLASTDALSRQAIMDSLKSVDDLGKKPLRIWLGDESGTITSSYYQFANAIIRSHDAYRILDGSKIRTAFSYSITATSLSKVTV